MKLREYRPEDCTSMADLFYETVHTVNAGDYTSEQLNAWATGKVDLAAWHKSFMAHDTLIAEIDGKMAGFSDMDGTGYLDRLYIHKDFQRRGLAGVLVNALEQRAQRVGIFHFETQASITAKPFFERQGYTVEARNEVVRGGHRLGELQNG